MPLARRQRCFIPVDAACSDAAASLGIVHGLASCLVWLVAECAADSAEAHEASETLTVGSKAVFCGSATGCAQACAPGTLGLSSSGEAHHATPHARES